MISIFNPYVLLAAGATLLATAGGAYVEGSRRASARCDTANLRVELSAAKADLQEAEHQRNQTQKRLAEAESMAELAQERINALAEDVSRREGGACLLDDADARRLRDF